MSTEPSSQSEPKLGEAASSAAKNLASTIGEEARDIAKLAGEQAKSLKDKVLESGAEIRDTAVEEAGNLKQAAKSQSQAARASVNQTWDRTQQKASNFQDDAEAYIRERPFEAVLSALWEWALSSVGLLAADPR